MTSFKEAKEAYRFLCAQGKIPSWYPERDTLDKFFSGSSANPEKPVPRDDCPDPVHWGTDELKCLKCGRVWDTHETKPDCYVEG